MGKLPKYGIRTLLLVIAVFALLVAVLHRTPITIRHSLGDVGFVSMAIITYGDRIDVLAETPNGEHVAVAKNLMLANESHLETVNGESFVVVNVYATVFQRYAILQHKNHLIEPRFDDL